MVRTDRGQLHDGIQDPEPDVTRVGGCQCWSVAHQVDIPPPAALRLPRDHRSCRSQWHLLTYCQAPEPDDSLPIADCCDDLPTPDQSIGFAAVETEPVVDRRHSEFGVWIVALLLAIIACFAILWPVLSTPFYADDIFNSQHSAHIAASDQSVWSYSASGVRQWMDNEGRFFPVSSIEGVFLFDTVHDRGLYKVIQVATTFIAAALLAVFIAVLTRDRRLGLLALFLTIPGFQQIGRAHV